MVYVCLAAAGLLFCLGLKRSGVIARIGAVLATGREAAAVIVAPNLNDEAKAVYFRAHALRLTGALFAILARTALATAVGVMPLLVGQVAGLFSWTDVAAASLHPLALAATAAAVGATVIRWR